MPKGTITNEEREFVETWENLSPVTNFVISFDSRGNEDHKAVTGRRKFTVTTEERMVTQEKILDPKNDPFLNGHFRPVIVPDSVNIDTNPNALSDEDISRIFRASQVAFEEWVNTLDSPDTLRRMLDLAEQDDEIALKRYQTLQSRLHEVTGGPKHANHNEEDEELFRKMSGEKSPSTSKKKKTTASKSRPKKSAATTSSAS